jgi:hypothetical protein
MSEEKPYIDQLEDKLKAARGRLRQGREVAALKESAPTLFDIIDTEISLAVNRMTQDKPLDYDAYLSTHGEVKGIKRIRNLIDAKEIDAPQAQAEVKAIEDNIKQIKDDQKQPK